MKQLDQAAEHRKYDRIKAELRSFDQRRLVRSEERLRKSIRGGDLHEASAALSLLARAILSNAVSGFANGSNTWAEVRLCCSQSWWAMRAANPSGVGEEFGHLLALLTIFGEDRRVLESLERAQRDMSRANRFTRFAVRAAELMYGEGDRFQDIDQVEPYASLLRGMVSGRVGQDEILEAISLQLSESFLDDPDDSRFLEFDGSIVLLPLAALLARKAVLVKGGEWPAVAHPMLSGPQWEVNPSAAEETESESLSSFVQLAKARGVTDTEEGG